MFIIPIFFPNRFFNFPDSTASLGIFISKLCVNVIFRCCSSLDIDFNKEPISLYYSDDHNRYLTNIFSEYDAFNDLKRFQLIKEAVIELFGIGETQWKTDLINDIKQYGEEHINYFLDDRFEDEARKIISKHSTNTKIYKYLKNYVLYARSGIYRIEDKSKNKINSIIYSELIEERFQYIESAKKEIETIINEIYNDYIEIEKEISKWKEYQGFDSEALKIDNSSYFHPIDDSDQYETLHMIARREHGIYSEETLEKIYNWNENIKDKLHKLENNLKYMFNIDISEVFNGKTNYQDFSAQLILQSGLNELVQDFSNEISIHIKNEEKLHEIENELLEIAEKYIKDNDEYEYDWFIDEINNYKKIWKKSKYTHKLREIENEILDSITSHKVKNVFNKYIDYSKKIILDKRINLKDVYLKLEELKYEEVNCEIDYDFLYQQCLAELENKNDYKISDVDYLINAGLIESEDEWIEIHLYLQEKNH